MNETLEQFINRTMEERKARRQQERLELEAKYKEEDKEHEELIRMINQEIERKIKGE